MIYLLDTHYVLWTLFDPARISKRVRAVLENDSDSKQVSGVNLWEISLKGMVHVGGEASLQLNE
jgi:PIN domain nuclease of toxin-antitoxin system